MRFRCRSVERRFLGIGMVILALALASCASVGPKTIPRDQFDYGDAISNSGKEQLLTNIVRLRYVEAPVFVNVSSVINQYSLESQVSAGVGASASFTGENTASLGGGARFTDRPTITYTPVSGRRFSISLLTPISPEAIFALVQAGWSPEVIMRMTVKSINGVQNASASPLARRQADPRFVELMRAWGRLRNAHALGLRRDDEGEKAKGTSRIIAYQATEVLAPEVERDLQFLRDAMGLDPQAREYTLAYGLVPDQPDEIAVLTYSMLELINELAWRADVPQEHVEEGRTGSTFADTSEEQPMIRVRVARDRPEDAYVTVKSRDHWFYIDDRDVYSKRTFAIMQILLSLTESGDAARGPVVTIGS